MELKNFIWRFVDKDKLSSLHGVYMDPEEKAAVASDACVMLVVHELYDPDKAGMVIFKDGTAVKSGTFIPGPDGKNTVKIKYPNWKGAIPRDYKTRTDWNGYKYKEVEFEAGFKERCHAATRLANTIYPIDSVWVLVHKETDYWVNPRFGKMMLSWGTKGWYIRHGAQPTINVRENGDLMLVMPAIAVSSKIDDIRKYGILCAWDDKLKDKTLAVLTEFNVPKIF